MNVAFADPEIAKIETPEAAHTRFSVAIIKSARRKLTVLRAAPDERALRNWKSLNYQELKGDREGRRSIRLNEQFRMVFELDDAEKPPKATILAIEDYD